MKKILFVALSIAIVISGFAQEQPKSKSKSKKQFNLKNRANDHFLLQLGYTSWAKIPDSIKTKGLPRTFNMYFMFDFPFKSNPRISVGLGAGVGSDNIYFDKTYVGIKDPTTTLRFVDQSDTNHFKKSKLATAYLEAPLELRFSSNPETPNKTFKVALGVKVGVLVNAHIKQKNLQTAQGGTLIDYIEKQNSKRFFNSNRIVGTARIGYGVFSVFGTYQLNPLFKEALGPQVQPYTIGITLSGL
ncbi:MAG TPA: outer membrane beta-barrel protein [Chitinophagaceae bacterium]|nr:outer membrane beta-barrel protein [Chitinophagaceae bacterium]